MTVKNNPKFAFTLAEALVMLLVATLIALASMPLLTGKKYEPTRVAHGKWACTRIYNDKKQAWENYSYLSGDASDEFPDNITQWNLEGANDENTPCKSPSFPSSVKNLTVRFVGGGAPGRRGTVQYVNGEGRIPITQIFAGCEGTTYNPNCSQTERTYVVQADGRYSINLVGAPGGLPSLARPSTDYYDASNHHLMERCTYETAADSASGNVRVPQIALQLDLQYGDRLVLEYENSARYTLSQSVSGIGATNQTVLLYNNGSQVGNIAGSGAPYRDTAHFCNYGSGTAHRYPEYEYVPSAGTNRIGFTIPQGQYTYKTNNQKLGQSGLTKKLYRVRGGEKVLIAEVYGGVGGYYYTENPAACRYSGFGMLGYADYGYLAFVDGIYSAKNHETMCAQRYRIRMPYSIFDETNNLTVGRVYSPAQSITVNRTTEILVSSIQSANVPVPVVNGGRGGAAGQIIIRPYSKAQFLEEWKTLSPSMTIGAGGNAVMSTGGGNTVFGSQVASGGDLNTSTFPFEHPGWGTPGSSLRFSDDNNSVGGEGGVGALVDRNGSWSTASDLINTETINGKNGKGLGAGGGGGGVLYYENNGTTHYGDGGNGMPGGIIVTW